ncbi:membrane protein [Microbacterium thalassium]|nr:membrane protein [Microbacterium thalassium]
MLWIGFAVVHVLLVSVEFLTGRSAAWDVDQLYRWWADLVVAGVQIPGITEAWVYPAFALVPIMLARLLATVVDYTFAWAVLVTAVDALAFALLIGNAASRGRRAAAWFWLLAMTALGAVGVFRLDALTVPLAVAGGLWLVGRPWIGSALLAAATWLKVWPAAMLAAAFIAVRRRWAVLGGAVAVSALIVLAVVAAGGAPYLLSFVGDQTTRGLQIEAPVSTVYLWLAVLGDPGAWVYYDADMITFQITGPNVDPVIAAMTPLMAVAMLAVAALGAAAAWRGARFAALFPPLALSLVLAFIVFNKVGSPQYMTWLIAPLVIGLVLDRGHWRLPALATLFTLALTQLIFPWFYDTLLAVSPLMVAVITVRNALLVGLFGWTVVRLALVTAAAVRTRTPVP